MFLGHGSQFDHFIGQHAQLHLFSRAILANAGPVFKDKRKKAAQSRLSR
jgi:hypothetical protein